VITPQQAMKNKVQGVVRLRVLVGANGGVENVRVIRHLPDGLDEEAIQAAYQLRFKPALRNGAAVTFWISLDVEFTLR
jgi:protein TonB